METMRPHDKSDQRRPGDPQLRAVPMPGEDKLNRPPRHWLHLAESIALLLVAICVVLAGILIAKTMR